MIKRSILILLLYLAACAPLPVRNSDSSTPIQTDAPSPTLTSTIQQKTTELAIVDLSKRLAIDPKTVLVISSESTDWKDSALECPRPGEEYAQGTVSGFRVRLEANGQIYEYHTDITEKVVLCSESDLPEFPVTPGEIDDGQPWMPVN